MRKKIVARKKYAEGGRVSQGLRSRTANANRQAEVDDAIMRGETGDEYVRQFRQRAANRESLAAERAAANARAMQNTRNRLAGRSENTPTNTPADGPAAGSMANSRPLPTPPAPPRRARGTSASMRRRSREMSAEELNDREVTRILNERSLEAARAGRSMFKKGGKVSVKKGKK